MQAQIEGAFGDVQAEAGRSGCEVFMVFLGWVEVLVDSALCCELTRIKSGPLRQLFELDQRSAAPVLAACGL